MAHTPGPWVTSDTKFANGIRTEVEPAYECGPICSCIRTVNPRKVRTWDEVDANAKLIAAAPELLDACKAALAKEQEGAFRVTADELGDILRAAIHKAEGKVK